MKKIITIFILTGCYLSLFTISFSQNLAPMPTPRYGTCAVVFNDEIYVIGGRNASGQVTGLVEVFNPATNSWRVVSVRVKEWRENAAAVNFMNTIYVLGGHDSEGEIINEVEYFDSSDGEWQEIEDMEIYRDGLSAVVLNERMYAIGGFGMEDDDNPPQFLNSTEYYDSGSNKWLLDTSWQLNQPRASFAAVVFNESVFIIGGFNNRGPIANVESYNTANGVLNWQSLETERGGFAAVVAQNRIFVLGGRNGNDEVTASIEYFDPVENTWTDTVMNTPRELFSAVVFRDTIYVFGGLDDEGDLVTAVEMIPPGSVTSVSLNRNNLPKGFALEQNYPNPFNPETRIDFEIPAGVSGEVSLSIYTITGQLVKRLIQGSLTPGAHTIVWDGRDAFGFSVASGVYLYELKHSEFQQSRKMLLVR